MRRPISVAFSASTLTYNFVKIKPKTYTIKLLQSKRGGIYKFFKYRGYTAQEANRLSKKSRLDFNNKEEFEAFKNSFQRRKGFKLKVVK